MDLRAASAIANASDLARWCEESAQELDALHDAAAGRPLSPNECRRMVDLQRQLFRRVSQHTSFTLAIYEPEVWTSPPPLPVAPSVVGRVVWWRRWLRRVVG